MQDLKLPEELTLTVSCNEAVWEGKNSYLAIRRKGNGWKLIYRKGAVVVCPSFRLR